MFHKLFGTNILDRLQKSLVDEIYLLRMVAIIIMSVFGLCVLGLVIIALNSSPAAHTLEIAKMFREVAQFTVMSLLFGFIGSVFTLINKGKKPDEPEPVEH